MSSDFSTSIVVGAGPVGMTLATRMTQLDLPVSVLERQPEHQQTAQGRLYTLNWPTYRMLTKLSPNQLVGMRVDRMNIIAPSGKQFSFTAEETGIFCLGTTIEEKDLLKHLHTAATETRLQVEYGQKIVSLQSIKQGWEVNTVSLTKNANLLIAADGAISKVARLAGVNQEFTDFKQTAISGWLKVSKFQPNVAWQWFTDHGILALLPSTNGKVNFIWSCSNLFADELVADEQLLCKRFNIMCKDAIGECSLATPVVKFPLRMAISKAVGTNLALVGDSAHLIHPLAGQGLSLGFGDAEVLLQCLKRDDISLARKLQLFSRLRYLRTKVTADLTSRMAKAISDESGQQLIEMACIVWGWPKAQLALLANTL